MSNLVGNLEDLFSCVTAHIVQGWKPDFNLKVGVKYKSRLCV